MAKVKGKPKAKVKPTKKAKRTNTPRMPKGKRRRLGQPSKISARARAAIARTKTAREAIDLELDGVDISDLAHLPVMVMVDAPPKRARKTSVHNPTQDDDDGAEAPIAPPSPRPPDEGWLVAWRRERKARKASAASTSREPSPSP